MAKISKKLPAGKKIEISQMAFGGIEELSNRSISHVPTIDMFSTAAELVIEVEVPGIKKEDLDISLFKNTLTIKADKTEQVEEDRVNYVCMERSFGKIFRTIDIPFPVDTRRIKAFCKDGVLAIVIPKVEDKRSLIKRIPIEST